MRNTGSSGRSKSSRDKGNTTVAKSQNHTTNTVKSEGPPVKPVIQATAEQVALNNLIQGKDTSDDEEQKNRITQIIEITGCSHDKAVVALYDSQNDVNRAINQVVEGGNVDESEWRETGKKKKKQKSEALPPPVENNMNDMKPEKRDMKERNDRDNRDRNKDDKEIDRTNRDASDYRRPRRNDNRPPRLSRGRGRPDRAGDRPEREDELDRDDNSRDRGMERGRGRGRGGFGPRRGRGGAAGSANTTAVGTFRPARTGGFEKNSPFDNGPQIDTWTNETAVIGEKEPKISNWGDSKEDWNEDIDSWSGSLAETKVFTASSNPAPEAASTVQIEPTPLPNTFDYGVLYSKHAQNDIGTDANYISQFNQQATESIKNSIGIGSGPSSSLQNSMTSQTASNVSALVSLQQNALHDNLGPSLNVSELTGNSLSGSSLTGNGLVGTSLGNSLSTSLPVNSLTGNSLHSTSLSGDLTRTSLSGNSLSGSSMTGASVTVGSLTGSTLVQGSQTGSSAAGGGIQTSSVSQNAAMLQQQQRAKPPRSKLPPPSKIPASAVEMPGHMMTTLDVQFGNLEFGSDSTPFSFGGGNNESVSQAFTSADSNSTAVINHAGTQQVGQVSLSKAGDAMLSSGLEQSSPRNSTLYQQSPYTTPTKQNPAESSNKINSPPEPLQMPGSASDMKSTPLITAQSPQVSLPSTKIDSSIGSYTSNSYQSTGYQSQKNSSGFPSSTKQGSYQGNQYQSNNNQTSSNQFSSQYRSSSQNQFPSGSTQFPSGSQYQSPPSGYQSGNSGYQSSQSNSFQPNQSSQFQSGQNQYSTFQSGSTFPNQSSYSSNQSNQSSLYPSSTTSSFSSQSQQNSLYSQSARQGSYSNQSYLNHDHGASAGGSSTNFQTTVTQSNASPFKDTQTGATSYRDPGVNSSSKTRETPSDNSTTYSRDTNSASSFSDGQSLAYNRDSQSVGNSYSRDPNSSYKRDSKSASASYPRDTTTTTVSESASFNRDSQSASASFSARDGQTTGYRDQSGAAGYGNQAGSYPRDSSSSQTQSGFNPKPYRNSTEVSTTLQTSLTGSKLADSFSKMGVNDGSLDVRPSTNSQYDATVTNSKLTTNNSSSLTSSTTPSSSSSSTTTVTSSTTTKISTLPTASSSSSSSSKAPPNLPPGVPLMAQQYIMGQAGTLPFYGLQSLQGLAQQPMYANIGNLEDFQYVQQRMPPNLAGNNPMYDLSTAAAAGLQMPPTSLTSNSTQQTVPTVPYSGSTDSTGKLNRVEAQSPTGSVPTSTPSATGQTAAQQHQQQPYIHLNYSYYYPPSLIPGAGFQYPMIPMPQVTNAAHAAGTPANTQYQQKNQYASHVQYGTNKVAQMYDDLNAVQSGGDFSKSPYANSQTQPKANVNTSVNAGSGSSDIQLPGGYGKTHAQAFDKQGFHTGTPPPFGLQMAAGQLATGTQAGPLAAPGAPYGGPFLPMMTHQPHSQMMQQHPLQDNSTSNRGSQQTASHSQTKNTSKTYAGSNWGSY